MYYKYNLYFIVNFWLLHYIIFHGSDRKVVRKVKSDCRASQSEKFILFFFFAYSAKWNNGKKIIFKEDFCFTLTEINTHDNSKTEKQ